MGIPNTLRTLLYHDHSLRFSEVQIRIPSSCEDPWTCMSNSRIHTRQSRDRVGLASLIGLDPYSRNACLDASHVSHNANHSYCTLTTILG